MKDWKYCKKGEFVEAIRLESCQRSGPATTILAYSEAPPQWITDAFNCREIRLMYNKDGGYFAVRTIRCEEYAFAGDWIVKDKEGLRVVKGADFPVYYSEFDPPIWL